MEIHKQKITVLEGYKIMFEFLEVYWRSHDEKFDEIVNLFSGMPLLQDGRSLDSVPYEDWQMVAYKFLSKKTDNQKDEIFINIRQYEDWKIGAEKFVDMVDADPNIYRSLDFLNKKKEISIKKLTIQEAYRMMFYFVSLYWSKDEDKDAVLSNFLRDINLTEDGSSEDPEQLENWKKAADKVLNTKDGVNTAMFKGFIN